MRILIVSDAWFPQVNGVVRTLSTVGEQLEKEGHQVRFVTPDQFRNVPCPTYPEIRLALAPGRGVRGQIEVFRPEAIHIATEGPLGLAARRYCRKHKLPFTSSFHTRFPEYIKARVGTPLSWGYSVIRWFHGPAARTMVATETLRVELFDKGLGELAIWSRGVDLSLFHPKKRRQENADRPVWLYVGRVAVEKSVEDFLKLDLDGTKWVVGDGPQLEKLRRDYQDAVFWGAKRGEELAALYASADAFVFPSRTDTFGNVLLEALASGVPVAAYPVPGPNDVINGAPVGVLMEDLETAARKTLSIPAESCRAYAERFSWHASAMQFLNNLEPISGNAMPK